MAKKIKYLKCGRTEVLFDFLGENKLGAGEASWKVAGEKTPRRPTGLPSLPLQTTLQRRDCAIRPRGAQGLFPRCQFLVFQSCFWVLNTPMFLLSRTRTQAPLCCSRLSGSLVASRNQRDFTEDHFYLQNVWPLEMSTESLHSTLFLTKTKSGLGGVLPLKAP